MRPRMRACAARWASVNVSSLWTRRSAWTQHKPCGPTLNWPASSLTITVSASKPCALTLPHRAPSVAISTGSGWTFRAATPSRSIQMSAPRRAIGEDAILMLTQAGDDGSGERTGAHIGQGFVIDDVIAMPGAQQFEEVETTL